MAIDKPTPVQQKAVYFALKGRDVAMFTRTGTGKTLAFTVSAVEKMVLEDAKSRSDNAENDEGVQKDSVAVDAQNCKIKRAEPNRPRVLVVLPTRELCKQVSKVFKMFAHNLKFSVYNMQQVRSEKARDKALKGGIDVLVSTPGRIEQHRENGSLYMSNVQTVIIDEADTMINDFQEVRQLMRSLLSRRFDMDLDSMNKLGFTNPKRSLRIGVKKKKQRPECQFFLTSATASNSFLRDIRRKLTNIVEITDKSLHQLPSTLKINSIKCGNLEKLVTLENLVTSEPTLVFCNNINSCRAVEHALNNKGFKTGMYNSEMPAHVRESSFTSFVNKEFNLLICTDIAARGLDILHVTHVINFDFPKTTSDYVHRAGRTARFGATGNLTNIYTNNEKELVHHVLNPDVSVTRHSGAGKTRLKTTLEKRGRNSVATESTGEGFENIVFHKNLRRPKVQGTKGRKYKHDFNTRARGVVRKKRQEERKLEVQRLRRSRK
eukprot:g10453.t1